ncbi:MAG TPA: 1,4-alpha-glucan branching protein domain-containing protein, partial [Amycolatopsis sp.]|nr:1,4-alpha-glucan branching protein domain-containing protein [Amycolatopsis sp.]
AMLALSSDWAFMVTKDSAADYARRRAAIHTERFDAIAAGSGPLPWQDRVFGHVDARLL